MVFVLIYFAKFLLTFSICCPYNSSDLSGICICQGNFYLADSKVCVDGCPSLFSDNSNIGQGIYSCQAPSGDNGILFTLEFSKQQDLTATYIANSINSNERFANPNSIPYSQQSQLSPLPTIDRGFYFNETSSAISNTNHIPALYFALLLWIKPLAPGDILNAISNSNQYLMISADPHVYNFTAIIYDSSGNIQSITAAATNYYTPYWHQASIILEQTECNTLTVSFYLNQGIAGATTFPNTEAKFKSSITYQWIIGTLSNRKTFKGFIYWLQARSNTIQNYPAMTQYIQCLDNSYWTGSYCQVCSSGCSTWPWCVRGTDCSYCYTSDCISCTGYSLPMCTACNTGIPPGCCDHLATSCTQTWASTNCTSGKILIDGVCLHATPYGLNSTAVSSPVFTADFSGPFAGSYGTDLITGTSSSSYNYWNSPEESDPMPAKNRGLYFNSGQWLTGSINLSYTWSMGMWVYPITGTIISHDSNMFSIDAQGSMVFSLDNWNGASQGSVNSRSILANTWSLISYSVGFSNKITTITPYLNNVAGAASTMQDSVFRLPIGKLFIGKGQTYYNGFVAYFILWQVAISDFSALTSINALTGSSIPILWSCGYSYYYDGTTCQSCSSCTAGCTQGASCNICADSLCLQCSSFLPGNCNSCTTNASGSTCACNPGFYQVQNQPVCSACYNKCLTCRDSSYNSCNSCIPGYFLYFHSLCLINCPTGYSQNSTTNSCDLNSTVALGIYFSDKINLDSIVGVQVGSDNTNKYPNYDSRDPSPAYLRGYYFNGATYMSANIAIGPYFTISIWISITAYGTIFDKSVSGNKFFCLEILSGTLSPKLSLILNDASSLSLTYSSSLLPSTWYFIAFTGKIDTENVYTLNSYLNSAGPNVATSSSLAYFEDRLNSAFYIGTKAELSNGFSGFLYSLYIFNSEIYYLNDYIASGCSSPCTQCSSDLSCFDSCSFTTFRNGTLCSNCMETCNNGCRYPDTCILCKSKQCNECNSFSGLCTSCIANAGSDGSGGCRCNANFVWFSSTASCESCDMLCSDCIQNTIFECSNCNSGKTLVGNICLNDCPYGYGSGCSATSNKVIDQRFDSDFSGTYGIFITGISANTYEPFNSSEIYDPLPAISRGLYFNGNNYLLSSVPVYLSHTFSLGIWLYSISTGDLFQKPRLIITSTGSITLTVEDTQQTTEATFSLLGISFTGWNYFSFSVNYQSDATQIMLYLSGAHYTTNLYDKKIFRDQASTNLKLGKSDVSGFIGFIYYFQLWNSFNSFFNIMNTFTFCGTNQFATCLWACDISSYNNTSSCSSCNSCTKGCVRANNCNLCDDPLCGFCTGFGPGKCQTCVAGGSFDTNLNACKCDQGYYISSDGASCLSLYCFTGCQTCTGNGFYQCLSCSNGYYLLNNQCLTMCPWGYSANSSTNNCDSTEMQTMAIKFSNKILLDTCMGWNVGSQSTNQYPDYDANDPYPAYLRGYYFLPDKYLTTNFVLPPTFSISIWINPISDGYIIGKYLSGITWYVKIEQGVPTFSLALSDPSSTLSTTLTSIVNVLNSGWVFISFDCIIDENGITTINSYVNKNIILQASTLDSSVYPLDNVLGNIYIGHFMGGFTGFLWIVSIFTETNNALTDYMTSGCSGSCTVCSADLSCPDNCPISSYLDGNSCLACNSCPNGCAQAGSCNICYDQLCLTCTSFSSGRCTQCVANASGAPDLCICNQGYWNSSFSCIPCENFLNQNSVVASFTKDYSQIQFTFSISADASPANCSCLFDTTTLMSFGSGYSCNYAADYKSLTVSLGKGYTFSKENIVFVSGLLKNSALVCGNPPISFSVSVSLLSQIPTPSITFTAPKTLSILCETLKLAAIIGNDLPYEQFKWTFSSTPVNLSLSAYSSQYSNKYSDITIPQSSLTDSILSVTFSAKNNFGNIASVTQNINVTSSLFLNINFDTVPYTLISRLKSYSISISSITACTVSSNISVTWKIGQTSNNITMIDEASLRGNQTSQYVLIIPPKVLPASSNITFIFHAKDLVNLSEGESSLTIQTDVSDPVILFNRTDGPIGVSQDLLIDAGNSYDLDGKSKFSFQWLCLNGATDCSNFILNPSSSLMKINGNSLSVGIIYNFTVVLTKTTLNPIITTVKVSKSIFITVQQDTVPSVNIIEIGNSNVGIVNPDAAYRIQAQGAFASILWSSKENLPILFSSPLNYANLVVAQNSLHAGSKYTLEALINQNFVFTWTFYVNQGPKSGSLSVTPSSGYEMITQFAIEAINWVDPEDNIPIEYAFGYLISDNYQVISSKNLSSVIYSTFPYSSKRIMVSVDVYDSLLSKVTAFQSIIVSFQENANVDQYIDDVKTQLNSPDLNPISIPKLVSDLSSLSINRNYIVYGNYSGVDQQIQDSYNLAIDKITSYTQNTDPYSPSTYTTIFSMLKMITLNPSINNYDNIEKVSDIIKKSVINLNGKVQLDDNQVQTFIGICNNNFQVSSSEVKNKTDSISSIENNIKSVSSTVLSGMSSRENKIFLEDKISAELSKQPNSALSNFSSEIMGASIILASNTEDFLTNDYVGTSLILFDPISNGVNASFSLVSFTLTDLSTHDAIALNNTNYNYISIPVQFTSNSSNITINCTYFEEGQSKWNTDGCVLDSFNNTTVICKCSHLSIFSAFFGGASDTAQSSNIDDTVNVNAFSNIDWDTNAIGLYFCAVLLLFYIVLTMLACKLDKKTEQELNIDKCHADTEECSKRNDELTEKSEDLTYRTDDSIIHTYRHKIGYDPSVQPTTQSSSQVVSRADSFSSIHPENVDAKPKKKRMSFFEFVGKNHDFISIFLPDRLFSHSSRVTAYTISLLGNMFFIGLFYQNGGEESNDDSGSMNFSDTINNYSFRDFWVMVYSSGIMVPIIIILRILAKRRIKENLDQEKQNKLKKKEKWKTFAFYLISWGLMGYFCWSIILFSIQFQLNLTYKWIFNTSVSYGSDIFVMPFVKMPIKLILVWVFTKLVMALGFSSSKHNSEVE